MTVRADENPFVSVIIPTYGREAVLCETIESLLAQEYAPFEVIVVDQTPRHEPSTQAFLDRMVAGGGVTVVRESIPSLPRARNIGVLHASAAIIVFIDDDVFLPPGFLLSHVRNFRDDGVAGVAGRIVHSGEDPDMAPELPISSAAARERLDLQIMRYRTRIGNPLHIAGGNASFRRCWIERNNGFSHRFTASALAEDVEFAGRLRRLGGRLLYDPDAWLVHRADPTGGCHAQELAPFSRSRERMGNFYYALVHGAGPALAVRTWLRRLSRRVYTDRQLPGGEVGRAAGGSRLASLAGRFVGCIEGIGRAMGDMANWGDLHRLPRAPAPMNPGKVFRAFGGAAPLVSVVVPTYGREAVLMETLHSVLAHDYPNFEVIVVDQTREHDKETREALERLRAEGRIQYVYESRAGASRARNIGVFHARGDLILFVDDDVTLLPGMMRSHVERYTDHRVWCVGGRIAWPGQNPDEAFPFPASARVARDHVEAPVCYHTTAFDDATHLITCNMSVRRDTFVMIGGFNEWFTGYGEDLDLVSRLRRAGGRCAYEPRAVLVHHSAPAGGIRLATARPLRFGYRRGLAHHYSILRAAGFMGWMATCLRRLGAQWRRFARLDTTVTKSAPRPPRAGPVAEMLAGGGGRGVMKALWHKAMQAAGSLAASPFALAAHVRDMGRQGDYARTARALRAREARHG